MILTTRMNLRSPRRGMTLLELLVVVAISVILLGTAVPMIRPALRSGGIREGSRQLNVYFAGAKARAIQTGRPVGVSFQRTQDGSNVAFDVFMVETPPPYSGDIVGATVSIESVTTAGVTSYFAVFDAFGVSLTATGPAALLQEGDTFAIRFGYSGQYFRGVRRAATFPINRQFLLSMRANDIPIGELTPGADGIYGNGDDVRVFPYQLLLPPRKSSVKPLQFSGGVCVDLEYSGVGPFGRGYDANINATVASNPVVVGFGPGGDVDFVSVAGVPSAPTGVLHFLIATADKVGQPAAGSGAFTFSESIADLSTVWVSVSPRTGLVTSAENGWQELATHDESVTAAREFGTSGQGMGGR